MSLQSLFDRHSSLWPDNALARIDNILQRDEAARFTRLSDARRSMFISLYNAIDMHATSYKPGLPPCDAIRYRQACRRILGMI